jgi:hypothetical protein
MNSMNWPPSGESHDCDGGEMGMDENSDERKPAREQMPNVTAWIDSLREAFGRDYIDQCIRDGLKDGSFWAIENGQSIGNVPEDIRRQFGGPASIKSGVA